MGETKGARLVCAGPSRCQVYFFFFLPIAITFPQERRFMAVSIFHKFLLFSQIEEALGRHLSASTDFHLPPAQNNLYAKVAYFEMAHSGPL